MGVFAFVCVSLCVDVHVSVSLVCVCVCCVCVCVCVCARVAFEGRVEEGPRGASTAHSARGWAASKTVLDSEGSRAGFPGAGRWVMAMTCRFTK
jgi:hypothetical protein